MNKNTIRLLYMLCQRSFLAVTSLLSLFSSGSFARFALPSVDAAAFAWTLPDVFLWSSSAYGCGGGGATYTFAARFARDSNYRREPVER